MKNESFNFINLLSNRELSFFYAHRLPELDEKFQKDLKQLILEKVNLEEINTHLKTPMRPRKNECVRCSSNKLTKNELNNDHCNVCLFITKRNSTWRSLEYFFEFLIRLLSQV